MLASSTRTPAPVRERLGRRPCSALGPVVRRPGAAALAARRGRSPAAARASSTGAGLEVVTLNGFPYRAFHARWSSTPSTDPDWTDPARLRYTLDLAARAGRPAARRRRRAARSRRCRSAGASPGTADARRRGRAALDELAAGLARLAGATGRAHPGRARARAGLRGRDHRRRPPRAAGRGSTPELARGLPRPVPPGRAWEEPARRSPGSPRRAAGGQGAGLGRAARRRPGAAAPATLLRGYDEPRFLHQTRELAPTGRRGLDDLPEALGARLPGAAVAGALPRAAARRADRAADATMPVLRRRSPRCSAAPAAGCDHLDVETYTWNVLPGGAAARRRRPSWSTGIAAELAFTRDRADRARAAAGALGGDAHDRRSVVVLDVVGLTAAPARAHAPAARRGRRPASSAGSAPVLPAVTCSVQSTLLTGAPPREHGIVGNGWYFRDLGEVLLWRQHHALVGGEKVWQAARRARPGYTVANVCWWYAMGADVDWTVTPRPVYHADGRKEPDCYTDPPELHDELTGELGTFPLFSYWGPGAGHRLVALDRRRPRSRSWPTADPDLTLVYLPHLDYDLQRFGPDSPRGGRGRAPSSTPSLGAAARRRRAPAARPWSRCPSTASPTARRPVDVNRRLRARRAARRATPRTAWSTSTRGRPARSRSPTTRSPTSTSPTPPTCRACAKLLRRRCPASPRCSTRRARPRHGLDHPRAGELVAGRRAATPGSPTTTGSTTPRAPGLRPRRSRSTASPATTRPSCSSTRPTARGQAPGGRVALLRKKARHALPDERRRPRRRARASAARTAGCPPTRPTARCCSARTRAGARAGSAATEVRDLLLGLAGVPAGARAA